MRKKVNGAWTQEGLNDLDRRVIEQRERLIAFGFPVSEWEAEMAAKGITPPVRNGLKKLTQPPEWLGSTQGYIPAGFSEFKPHPAHGKPVRRCLAKNKYREDGQCCRYALKTAVYCKRHAGTAMAPKVQKEPSHFIRHGTETRQIRKERKASNLEMREISRIAVDLGIMEPGMRGPRPNKKGVVDWAAYRAGRKRRMEAAKRQRKHTDAEIQELIRKLEAFGVLTPADVTSQSTTD